MLNISTPLLEDNSLCIIGISASIFLNNELSFCHKICGHLKLGISLLLFNLLYMHVAPPSPPSPPPRPRLVWIGTWTVHASVLLFWVLLQWDDCDVFHHLEKKNKTSKLALWRILDVCHAGNHVSRQSRSKSCGRYQLKGWVFVRTNDLSHLI